jgi:predicted aldo/keto reductase-like oxidoreductase
LSAVSAAEFWQRLRAAFEFLEQSVANGTTRNYGVATWNGFRAEPDAGGYHSLERMVEIAKEVAGNEHHFRFIQVPFNLAMPEALFFQNQPLGDQYVSTLAAAHAFGITAVASGSLLQGQVAHGLPEAIRDPLGALATDAQTGIQFVRSAPGITTALVGMSHRAHVEENLQLAAIAPSQPDDLLNVFDPE